MSSRIGDVAEFLFDAKAVQRDLIVNRPIHAGTIYDRVIEYRGKFSRVQIKCTTRELPTQIKLTRHNGDSYPPELVDVFAIYILRFDSWYLFKNDGRSSFYVNGNNLAEKENWSLFYEEV